MKKFKNVLLKVAFAFALLFGCVPAFAEGEAIDLTAATTQITAMQTAITTWITANAPTLVKILGAALVIVLIWVGFKWIKKGTNRAG